MKKLITIMGVILFASAANASNIVDIPMDAQINIGRSTGQSPSGDAIYNMFGSSDDTLAFMSDEAEGYTRHYLDGGGAGSWFYTYVDFYLTGETNDWIDITGALTLEFDTRYYQDPDSNSDPYRDAPVFVRLYTYDIDPVTGEYDTEVGKRDFGIVYATQQGDLPYPTWTHVVIDLTDPNAYDDKGTPFDPTKVSRLRFYGTDWDGTGDDFVDFKNLVITPIPEPSIFLLGGFGLLALIRRKK